MAILYLLAIILGIVAGSSHIAALLLAAKIIAFCFVTLLKWLSIPLIVLSILTTTSRLHNKDELLQLGAVVLKYTLLTTIIAATSALLLFVAIDPIINFMPTGSTASMADGASTFGVILISAVLGTLFASFLLLVGPNKLRRAISQFVSTTYQALVNVIKYALKLMPIAIWAFVVMFMQDVQSLDLVKSLSLYLACVVLANLTQALVILPIILKIKKLPVLATFKGAMPALSLAFWSKSSSVALPLAIECAQENLQISKKISSFSLPLCTTINMNACAAFILITVLFVSGSNGIFFSHHWQILWIGIATLAAIGNAGVPMGCYTLSGALLGLLGVPLGLLGLILPFYSLIDMLESAINVWSDICVTMMVEKDITTC